MPKYAPDGFYDAAFDWLDQADTMVLCSAQPATYADVATYALADVAVTADTDFTKAAGSPSGRAVTVAAKSAIPVDTTGTGTHVALMRAADSTLRYVTTCPPQAVTAGGSVNVGPWSVTIPAPT